MRRRLKLTKKPPKKKKKPMPKMLELAKLKNSKTTMKMPKKQQSNKKLTRKTE